MVDEKKLRELAGAATPGLWHRMGNRDFGPVSQSEDQSFGMFIDCGSANSEEDADYIAAANPAAILALLDELQTLRDDRDSWVDQCSQRTTDAVEALQKLEVMTQERTAWRVTAENAEAEVKQAREDALEEAKQAITNVVEPNWSGYEFPNTFQDGVHACIVAIESLKGKP